ncbi:MAG: indole-3-glycerol phosphate synthase TrpC [bacterium]
MKTILDTILGDVHREIAAAKARIPLSEIQARLADAPPARDFADALSTGFGLITEIKERSPSVGPMRADNVRDATNAYAASPIVRAVSVLTNQTHFGMDIHRLSEIRNQVPQPVLRKDFFVDDYQVYEARAFGADAILLMANVLDAARLLDMHQLALELGMEALFEVHTPEEIDSLPAGASIVGINSRKFKTDSGFVQVGQSSETDFSLDLGVFDLVSKLPVSAKHVAESGISPRNLPSVASHFHAALVGTSLLRDERGIRACLKDFESALAS